MLSKEEIEQDNTFKISMPLITEEDKRKIDNNFETIVAEFTKSYVKEKDLVLTQYVMKKQQDKIDQLESDKQKLIEKLEEDIKHANDNIKHMKEKNILQTIARELAIGMRDYAEEILSILKGN